MNLNISLDIEEQKDFLYTRRSFLLKTRIQDQVIKKSLSIFIK